MLLAEFQVGQVLWSLLWFFLFFLWIWLVISLFGDIIRSDDLSGWGKAIWSLFIIVLPFLGVFMYLIVRGNDMGKRQAAAMKQSEQQFQDYIRDTAGGGSGAADELEKLSKLHESGVLDDAEYAAAKAKVLNG